MSFLSHFNQSEFDLVGTDGQLKGSYKGTISDKSVHTEDISIDAVTGDEIRRKIPNGREEVFEVISSMYHEKFHAIDAHFIIKTRRKGLMDPGAGGNYSVTVSGHNSSVNIGSGNRSTNISHGDVYNEIERALSGAAADQAAVAELKALLGEMRAAQSQPDRLSAYQRFIAAAANHMVILTPFLPQLTTLLIQS